MVKMSVILGLTAVTTTWFWGGHGIWLTAVVALALGGWWYVRQTARVRVGELEAGVVFKSNGKTFVRFLPPGKYWLRPFKEQLAAKIPTGSAALSGQSSGVASSGGLPLTIAWTLQYRLNPFRIAAAAQPGLARTLPRKAGRIAHSHLDNCLRHVVGAYTVAQLCQPGMQKKLERAIRQTAVPRLAPLGFELERVLLGAIEMPRQVRAALAAAHEQQVQTEVEVQALQRLQGAISQFSEADMARLLELERIQKLGQNGVTLVYPGGGLAAREAGAGTAVGASSPPPRRNGQRAVAAPPLS